MTLSFSRTSAVPATLAQVSIRNKHFRHEHLPLHDKYGADDDIYTRANDTLLFGFPRDTVATPLAILLLAQFILFIGVGAVIPSIPLYGKEIGLSGAANGIVISAPAVAMLLGAKWGGNFADVARKPAMLIGMAVIFVSDIGTALASDIVMLLVARMGLGAGRCVSEAGERGMLADIAGRVPQLRGRALAAQSAVGALGIAIGAPLGGMVVEEYGPRASFLCVSAAALVALIMYTFLPETTISDCTIEDENGMTQVEARETVGTMEGDRMFEVQAALAETTTRESAIAQGDWKKLLSQNQWRGLALCQCGTSSGYATKIANIPILATAVLGGATGAGALISAAGLSGLVGAPLGGWLVDRVGAKSTAILTGIVSATGLLLIPLALGLDNGTDTVVAGNMTQAGLAFSLVVILWSLGASAQGPALAALAQQLAPAGAEATAMALPRAFGDGTYIVAPFLLGLVADATFPGTECAAAGVAILLGVAALALLGTDENERR